MTRESRRTYSSCRPKTDSKSTAGCKLPEVDTIDLHEGSITMVVHDVFRHETR